MWWRVVLTVVAAVIDANLLLIVASSTVRLGSVSIRPVALPASTPSAAAHGVPFGPVIFAVVLVNLLAVLFGARLRPPGGDRQAVARIFE